MNQQDATLDPKSASSRDQDQEVAERHSMRMAWFFTEAHRQSANRQRMAKCEAFYDNEQIDHNDAAEIESRGQLPVVYNEIKPTIDWLIGIERRSRVDFTVMASTDEEGADEDASNKTELLKYLDQTNNSAFERSWAAEDAFKAGIGWLEIGVRGDVTQPEVYCGHVSWREILVDTVGGRRRDLEDRRYLFRVKVVDLDIAEALFPNKKDELRQAAQDGDRPSFLSPLSSGLGVIAGLDDFNLPISPIDELSSKPVDLFNLRKRVMLIECWSREPLPRDPAAVSLGDPVTMKMRVSIMTEFHTLLEEWSPYKHDRFPFVPIWAYINRRTGLAYSPVWPVIGPQTSLNHRMSKSLYEASSNQWVIEKDAIDKEVMDIEEVRDELNRPDGMAIVQSGGMNKIKRIDNQGAVQHQLVLADQDRMTIRAMSGVTGENRGLDTNAVSGKAVLAKQDQGSMLTAELFDNLLLARKLEGEITLSLVEQYMAAPMTIPKNGSNQHRIRLNEPMDDGTYANDICARAAKFVIGEQAWKQAYAESMFESLFTVVTQLAPAAPQVVVNLLDLIFQMHPNLPMKSAIVERMRAINGQQDPDGRMTPEQEQANQQKAAMAQKQLQMEMDRMAAEIAKAKATGEKLTADAMRVRLTALYEAAQAAQVLSQVPETAPIADELAKSAGFIDHQGAQSVIDTPPQGPQFPPLPELQQADGIATGIQTPGADGVIQPQE